MAMDDPLMPAAQTLKNCRRVTCMIPPQVAPENPNASGCEESITYGKNYGTIKKGYSLL
jgi:hypothetical protein